MTAMAKLSIVKPKTAPQRATQTTMDTIAVTPEQVNGWKNPPFQRPLKVNARVKEIAEQIRGNEVVPGIITLGVLSGDKYLLDGQHRREAFLISGVQTGYCDVRVHHFESMADMGREFVQLNSRISTLRPDDILRGMEGSVEALAFIRRECPFVGYDMIRRGPTSPLLSMSLLLRSWYAARAEVPSSTGHSAMSIVESITMDSATLLVRFLKIAHNAWGRDQEYQRLWSSLNMAIVMWLYKRVVLDEDKRYSGIDDRMFAKGMMSLSADNGYLSWLVGRMLNDRDRSPGYSRIKTIMARRFEQEIGNKMRLPQPGWAGK